MRLFTRVFVALMPKEAQRNKYLRKKHIFAELGKNSIFVPRIIPSDPEYIKIGENVIVAARVTFINHDVSHYVFGTLLNKEMKYYHGCIQIGNNVFIGSNTTILPNVFIHDNTFVAAGSVVTKDLESGFVWAGVPAKKIGTFDDLMKKRLALGDLIESYDADSCWKYFESQHK